MQAVVVGMVGAGLPAASLLTSPMFADRALVAVGEHLKYGKTYHSTHYVDFREEGIDADVHRT